MLRRPFPARSPQKEEQMASPENYVYSWLVEHLQSWTSVASSILANSSLSEWVRTSCLEELWIQRFAAAENMAYCLSTATLSPLNFRHFCKLLPVIILLSFNIACCGFWCSITGCHYAEYRIHIQAGRLHFSSAKERQVWVSTALELWWILHCLLCTSSTEHIYWGPKDIFSASSGCMWKMPHCRTTHVAASEKIYMSRPGTRCARWCRWVHSKGKRLDNFKWQFSHLNNPMGTITLLNITHCCTFRTCQCGAVMKQVDVECISGGKEVTGQWILDSLHPKSADTTL